MRMEQYIQMVDYSLWEVIKNGDAPPITKAVEGVENTIAPATAKEKAQKRLEPKARSTLLMGIPNEHQLKFGSIKDAKSLLQAVEKSTQATAVNSTTIDNLSDAVICSLFMARLTMGAMRFLKNTRRKFSMNCTETIRFDKSKMECYNYHKKGHSSRECMALRNQENKNREKSRRSLGYNVVPPPYTGNFMPPKPDLSFSGLEEFVNEPIVSEPTVKKPIVEPSEAKASVDKPKVERKNFGSTLIEDWISDSEDEATLKSKIEKKTVKPSFC
nr:hypothetical protein [Tanacetum cinerariifolium]